MYSSTITKLSRSLKSLLIFPYSEFGCLQNWTCRREKSTKSNTSSTKDKPKKTDKIIIQNEKNSSSGTHENSQQNKVAGSEPGQNVFRRSMKAWELHSFGGPTELQFTDNARIPVIQNPNDVLIRVKAASINPLDVAMTKGYGAETIQVIRKFEKGQFPSCKNRGIEFPLTLGRDFSGVVAEVGAGVSEFKVGDEVYGVLGFSEHGSHAEYTITSKDLIHRKPAFLSHVEAASFPYVGLTFYSAIKLTGHISDPASKRFLILGGSGGVGTFAIQYLKSQGATVTVTCSPDAIPLVQKLGADHVIDYTQQKRFDPKIFQVHAPYHCILNCAGPHDMTAIKLLGHLLLKPLKGQYISLSPPLLKNFDEYGFFLGGLANFFQFMNDISAAQKYKTPTKWAFFVRSPAGLRDIANVISQEKIKPVVEQIYPFSELPKAYERVGAGHIRGKIVTDLG